MSEWTGTQGEAYDKIDRYLRKNLWCDDYAEFSCALKILWDTPPDDVAELVDALRWYQEQARLCRMIHSEGDAGREALADDGGNRAKSVLAKWEGK